MKCLNCKELKCGEKFENKSECLGAKEKINCSCRCQPAKVKRFGVLSAITGLLFSKAVPADARISEVMTPIQAIVAAECINVEVSVTDAVLTAAIDVIEHEASILTKGASGFEKLGVRMAAGGIKSFIEETVKGEVIDETSVEKAIFAGAIDGATAHVVSNLTKVNGNEVIDAAARVALQAVIAAKTEANEQFEKTGEIDEDQLFSKTVEKIAIATAAELSQSSSNTETDQNEASLIEKLSNITLPIAVDLESPKKKAGVGKPANKLFSRFKTNKPSTSTTPPIIQKVMT